MPSSPAGSARKLYRMHEAYDTYNGPIPARQEEVASPGEADVVSSLNPDGFHAPVLDLDIPAALVPSLGGVNLWVDAPLSFWRYRRMMNSFHDLALGGDYRDFVTRASRRQRLDAWEEVRRNCVDTGALAETLRALGPEVHSSMSLEELMQMAIAALGNTPASRGPAMKNPWRIPLDVGATLLPSTTPSHSHLYLETRLHWNDYEKLLLALRKGRLLERDYHQLALRRCATQVRVPWNHKDS